jgi:hypothetical protein
MDRGVATGATEPTHAVVGHNGLAGYVEGYLVTLEEEADEGYRGLRVVIHGEARIAAWLSVGARMDGSGRQLTPEGALRSGVTESMSASEAEELRLRTEQLLELTTRGPDPFVAWGTIARGNVGWTLDDWHHSDRVIDQLVYRIHNAVSVAQRASLLSVLYRPVLTDTGRPFREPTCPGSGGHLDQKNYVVAVLEFTLRRSMFLARWALANRELPAELVQFSRVDVRALLRSRSELRLHRLKQLLDDSEKALQEVRHLYDEADDG